MKVGVKMSWKKKLATYTLLTVTVGTTVHLINKFINTSAIANNLLKVKNDDIYHWRFGDIYYEKTGEGSPILLIHDMNTCSSSYEWNKIVSTLSKTNTVYTIDLLGCGRSEKPDVTYTNFLYVQLINDFIKNVIKEKTDIIATGESSAIAIMAAANNNDIIDRMILINPVCLKKLSQNPTAQSKILKQLICLPIIGTFLYNMLINKKNLKETFISEYYYNPKKVNDRDVDAYFESAHIHNTNSKYLFASITSKYTNANVLNCLKNLSNSIFILAGRENAAYKEIAEFYQKELPSIEIVEIEKTKYLPHMESPKEVIEQIQVLFDL